MKTRLGFVSNSSSSSFVCDVCGESYSGWDADLRDAEMYICENGHTICVSEALDVVPEEIYANLEGRGWELAEDEKEYTTLSEFEDIDDLIYNIPECCCPICNFTLYSESDMVNFLFKKYGVSKEDAFAEVKALNKRRRKLYDTEYVIYVCKTIGTTVDAEFEYIKETFGVYSKLTEYLKS